jgi:ACT domain-containing protein
MWGCILLLWHFEIKEIHSDSDIVLKVENSLSETNLRQWHVFVKEAHKMHNQSTLSLESAQQLSIAENLTWQNGSLAKLQEDVLTITQRQGIQEHFNTAVVERLDVLQENSQQIIQLLENMNHQHLPKRRKRDDVATSVLIQGQIPFQQVEQAPLEAVPPPIREGKNNLPPLQHNVKPLSDRLPNIETLFYTWYIDELWNYTSTDKNEMNVRIYYLP